ncbi:hypothetical protein [Nocardiopsis sp. CNT312]|uniref:hypothetical protein n=1 Tax=Nocardiopsis sp. CNT312 TaxID=1137268 RepID=UPI000687FAAE|nr:hypothetical protein [Nocardiopsis sp. CNT312]
MAVSLGTPDSRKDATGPIRIGIGERVLRAAMRISGARTGAEADTAPREHAALERFAGLSRTWGYEGWSKLRAEEKNT